MPTQANRWYKMFEEYRLQEQWQIANEQLIVNKILTLKIKGDESKLLIEIYHMMKVTIIVTFIT